MAGNLNLSWELDELQSLSPVVRQEVLTGELGRRVKNLETVPAVDLDRVVNALVSLSLSEVVQGIHNPEKFATQVKAATERIATETQLAQGIHDPEKFAAQVELAAEQLATESKPAQGIRDPEKFAIQVELTAEQPATESKPAQGATGQIATESSSIVLPSAPGTPTAVGTPLLTPPRTSSPSGSLAVVSDRDRLVIAVSRLELDPDKCGTIADLLLTLTKKERALCIFNVEYLKTKVAEAREVLEADDAEDVPASYRSAPAAPNRPPTSPVPVDNGIKSVSEPAIPQSLPTPTTSPQSLPASPPSGSKTYTLTSLALLPAKEIIKLTESPSEALTGLPLPKADPLIIKATDEFVDTLASKPIPQQKQLVGEKL
jgi:polyadenylate-binding protein